MENSRNVVIGLVILLVLVVAGAIWLGRGDEANRQTGAANQPGANGQGASGGDATVTVNDQFPGQIVYLSNLSLPTGGWVVIHEDGGGAPGAVVGQKYFSASDRVGVINLNQTTINGRRYWAMVHTDNGDGIFDPTVDLPAQNAVGENVMVGFNVTTTLPENKG
ncbi:MAG: hypothetical protein AAB468_01240 [Patescibacteria group bacterium]